ncbi:hypothetical protein TI03_02065 [Achromatium sp. WMS1]|nr:hypothetical protein TI03_02065 [Achromatium sp. WMS1]
MQKYVLAEPFVVTDDVKLNIENDVKLNNDMNFAPSLSQSEVMKVESLLSDGCGCWMEGD